ncbi:hypothetical protein C0992_005453 [Termitomyces sp. T32_za158]|nr:hypothetical protein C0992_005453 [Termitomyces sp. T32_za158]
MPRLIVHDLTNDSLVPTMDVIRRANFPMKMLDENLFAPRKTIPTPDESASEEVFAVQINFISGGILLTFVGHHSAMDMTGQGEIIRLLSKACHNESFTSEELSIGNLCRQNLIRPLDNFDDLKLFHQLVRSDPDSVPLLLPESTWACFTFSASSLLALKSRATKTISHLSEYVSTDDALSAFVWQSVIRARLPRLASNVETTLARAVDVRRHLNIPLTYPGLIQNMTYHTYTLQQLVTEPLGVVASQLRLAVDVKTSDVEYRTRALATFINNAPDKSIVSFTATIDSSKDIMISSWSKVQGYELDFNYRVSNEFQANKEPTIGAAFLTQKCRLEDRVLRYEIWDTAGQERFHSLAPMYYRNAQAAVVVYDITKSSSLEKAKSWVKELQRQANPNIVIALAGNKLDLVQPSASTSGASSSESEDEADDATATPGETQGSSTEPGSLRQVPREEAQAYATEAGLLFFETSAKTGEGVVDIFTEIGNCFSDYHWQSLTLFHHLAKKIPIEHILAATRGTGRLGAAGRADGVQQQEVNLQENQAKTKDACNC